MTIIKTKKSNQPTKKGWGKSVNNNNDCKSYDK